MTVGEATCTFELNKTVHGVGGPDASFMQGKACSLVPVFFLSPLITSHSVLREWYRHSLALKLQSMRPQ